MEKIKNILGFSWFYTSFSKVIGAASSRDIYVRQYLKPQTGQSVLDVGCGPADILEHLPSMRYVGFDSNPSYIETAKKKWGKLASFHCCEVGQEEQLFAGQSFDLVMVNGVLHHLSDEQVVSVLNFAKKHLLPQGRLVTFDGCYTADQSVVAKYLLDHDRGQYVREEAAYVALAQSVFSNVKVAIRHDLLRIPYTHIIMECSSS